MTLNTYHEQDKESNMSGVQDIQRFLHARGDKLLAGGVHNTTVRGVRQYMGQTMYANVLHGKGSWEGKLWIK